MIAIDLSGKTALVTGAASGIGRQIALRLFEAGASIAAADRDAKGLQALRSHFEFDVYRFTTISVDLADENATRRLVGRVVETHNALDILVNAAGIPDYSNILDLDCESFRSIHAINLVAPLILMQEAGKHMVERGCGGKIVNISSSAAFTADFTAPPAYSSAKAGLNALTRSVAGTLGPHDINVNAVAPGLTRTPLVGAVEDEAIAGGPLANLFGRISEPDDVANIVAFLCSPMARQITAQVIHCSAGNVV